ncbi:FecR family protein [Flavivirga spongiicola]|uniref:FecR domain-containing protein n=1 Tax=Flavivirga spongiicola TaxID=421621 RepID=A0ABU7XWT1_9FLAO|nr:FecR family protein [Flavivirga sp. MEBiC05379]MDO5980217.1 FecR domain-containing protein [Flavivirga sp. MEBiC05379]
MNTYSYIEKLFQKYIEESLTQEEFITLMEFIRNPESQNDVKDLFGDYWKSIELEGQEVLDEAANKEFGILFNQITSQIKTESLSITEKKPSFFAKHASLSTFSKIAASIIFMLGIAYLYNHYNSIQKHPDNSNEVTLTLDNGKVEIVSEEDEKSIIDESGTVIGEQSGTKINYTGSQKSKIEKLVYNELTIPNGKRFYLVLSDGTKVTLNAGTSLKYPVKFLKGQSRKVFLKGEAYFDVAVDKSHPFIVNANDINVEVLGTEFNLSYYPEDANINTVLIEGSVKLYTHSKKNDEETLLTPGHLASWDKSTKEITIKKVDTQMYTAWKDGSLVFNKTPYPNILKKLERHFDVVIENEYSLLDEQIYTTSFDKDETIENVLNVFRQDIYFNYRKTKKLIKITN